MARERFDSGQKNPTGLQYDLDAPSQFGGSQGTFVNRDTGQGTFVKEQVSNPESQNVDRYRGMGEDMSKRGAYQLDWREADQDRAQGVEARGLQYDSNKLLRDQALGNDRTSYNYGQSLIDKGAQAQRAGAMSTRGGALAQMTAMQDQQSNEGAYRQKGTAALEAQRADDMAAGRAGWMAGTTAQRKGDQTSQYLADQQAEAQARSELQQRQMNSQGQRAVEQMGLDTRAAALGGRQASAAIARSKQQASDAAQEASRNRAVGMMNSAVGAIPIAGQAMSAGLQGAQAADQSGRPDPTTSDRRAKNLKPNAFASLVPPSGYENVQVRGLTTIDGGAGDAGDATLSWEDAGNAGMGHSRVVVPGAAEAEGSGASLSGPTRFGGRGDKVNRADTERMRGEILDKRKQAKAASAPPARKRPLVDLLKEGQGMLAKQKVETEAHLGQGPAVKPREEGPDEEDVREIRKDDGTQPARRSDVDTIKYGARGGEPDAADVSYAKYGAPVAPGLLQQDRGAERAPKGLAARRAGQAGGMFGAEQVGASSYDADHGVAPGTRDVLKYGTPSERSEKTMDDYSKAIMVSGVEAKIPATISDEQAKNKAETPEQKKAREDKEDAEQTAKFMGDAKGPVYKAPETYEEKSRAIDENAATKAAIEKRAKEDEEKGQANELLQRRAQKRADLRTGFGASLVPDSVRDYLDKKSEERESRRSTEDLAREARDTSAYLKDKQKRHDEQEAFAKRAAPKFFTGAVERVGKWITSDEEAKTRGESGSLHELQQDANRKLAGETYTYKDGFGEDPSQLHHGFMAQNLEQNPITATAVREGEDGVKKVDMQDAVRVTASGVAENQEQIDELEAAIAKLRARRRSA